MLCTKRILESFLFQKTFFLTRLNYDTGLKSKSGDKNIIIEALKKKDINNLENNNLISINDRDNLIQLRQFLLMQNFESILAASEKTLENIRGYL